MKDKCSNCGRRYKNLYRELCYKCYLEKYKDTPIECKPKGKYK
jgi:NMD protein affecting ribosome stability and mRNA decay